MVKRWHRRRRATRGQVLILLAVGSVLLVGLLALAVDVGFLLSQKRGVQNAADAAALAVASAMLKGETNDSTLRSTAAYYVRQNGYDVTPQVDYPDDDRVRVEVEYDVPKFFLGVVYTGSWKARAHGMAALEPEPADYALLALKPPGIKVIGGPRILVVDNGGGIMSNGEISANGASNRIDVEGSIDAAEEINKHNNATWTAPGGLRPGQPIVPDPLADVPPPPTDGLTEFTEQSQVPNCSNPCTLQPGYYQNVNLHIRRTATMQPGLYVFENTSITFQNTNSTLQGTDVLLYFGAGASIAPKNGNVRVSAPDVAPYPGAKPGMVLWISKESCAPFEMQGNTDTRFEGIFYAPCSKVKLYGNPYGDTVRGQVIVDNLEIAGNSEFKISYRGHAQTSRPAVWLVE